MLQLMKIILITSTIKFLIYNHTSGPLALSAK